jgi:quercetin dioxygenase-like cupin family protein
MDSLKQNLRTDLLSVELPTDSVTRAQMTRVELEPGQVVPLHSHPCDVVGLVLSGKIRFEIEGQAAQLLEVGDAFHEPRDARIASFDNCSATEPAAFVAIYLLPQGEERVIEILAE